MSKGTYERLRAYCETNGISMSQFVEKRVGEVLGRADKQPAPGAQPQPQSAQSSSSPRKDADVKLSPDRIFTF